MLEEMPRLGRLIYGMMGYNWWDFSEAPEWTPDSEAPRCEGCWRTFTIIRRRHHCRRCGGVFCNSCCDNRRSIPQYGYLHARVCDGCLWEMATRATDPRSVLREHDENSAEDRDEQDDQDAAVLGFGASSLVLGNDEDSDAQDFSDGGEDEEEQAELAQAIALSQREADEVRIRLDAAGAKALIWRGTTLHNRVSRAAARLGLHASLDGQSLVLRGPMASQNAPAMEVEVARLLSDLSLQQEECTEEFCVPPQVVGRLIGPGGSVVRMLMRDLRVHLRVFSDERRLVMSGGRADVQRAVPKVASLLVDPSAAQAQRDVERGETAHVFVDHSGLGVGAQYLDNGERDGLVRLHAVKLAEYLQGVRQPGRQVVVASHPPANAAIWRYWRSAPPQGAGFELKLVRGQNVGDQMVAEALEHVRGTLPPGVLILGTGGGHRPGRAGGKAVSKFQNLVTTAVRLGWKVEVWTWRRSRGQFGSMEQPRGETPGHAKVCLLDPFRVSVTFRRSAPQHAAAAGGAEGDDEEDLCTFCLATEATHAYQPCGHRVLCEGCAADIIKRAARPQSEPYLALCAMCREPWERIDGQRQL